MPQAIERLLATPNTTPRFPAINMPLSAIGPPALHLLAGLYNAAAQGPEGELPQPPARPSGRLAGKGPGAVGLAAGVAFDLAPVASERERIDDMAAHAALVVAEGRDRPDLAHKAALWTLPDERHPVAELVERERERLVGRLTVAPIEFRAKFAEAWSRQGPGRHLRSSVLGLKRMRGGRHNRDQEDARPHDDRSVPTERTHNQSSPNSDAGIA